MKKFISDERFTELQHGDGDPMTDAEINYLSTCEPEEVSNVDALIMLAAALRRERRGELLAEEHWPRVWLTMSTPLLVEMCRTGSRVGSTCIDGLPPEVRPTGIASLIEEGLSIECYVTPEWLEQHGLESGSHFHAVFQRDET